MSNALIIVDVQYDFLPGGALGVPDGDAVLAPIIEMIPHYDHVVTTGDWHPVDHVSFSDAPEFVDKSWPPHCIQLTEGARVHQSIIEAIITSTKNEWGHFKKGTNPYVEAYSGFDGHETATGQSLEGWLRDRDVDRVTIVGLATDYCVRATALDADHLNFWTTVEVSAIRGVSEDTTTEALSDMVESGVYLDR